MNTQKKISVIIPVYNAEITLYRCLDSLKRQNCPEAEYLLIDDGSSDTSRLICEEFEAEQSNVVFLTQEHSGQAAARNLGLSHASGEFVFFADADDCLEDDALHQMIDAMGESDLLVFGYRQDQKQIKISDGEQDIASVRRTYFYAEPERRVKGSLWNKCFRRACIEANAIRFPEELRRNEEEVFLLRYLDVIHSVRFLDRVLYIFYPLNMKHAFVRIPEDYAQQVVAFQKICMEYAERWGSLDEQTIDAISREFYGKMVLALKLCLNPTKKDRKKFRQTAELLMKELPSERPVRSLRLYQLLQHKMYLLAYFLLEKQM